MKKAKADYYSNLFDEVDTAVSYSVAEYITTKAERHWNQRRCLAVVKEIPHRTMTSCQN